MPPGCAGRHDAASSVAPISLWIWSLPASLPHTTQRTPSTGDHPEPGSSTDILRAVMALRTTLRLRVVPGASRPGVVGRHGDAWKVRVAAPAEAGKANTAVLSLLAEALDVPRRDLALTSGTSSRDKVVALDGLSTEAAEARLTAASEGSR
jgi:uncharacterized protein